MPHEVTKPGTDEGRAIIGTGPPDVSVEARLEAEESRLGPGGDQ